METVMEKAELTEGIEKPYTLKKLCANNIFTFASILKNIGIKELKATFQDADIESLVSKSKDEEGKVDVEKVGLGIMIDIATVVISNLENCKDGIYQLLSELSGMTTQEISQLDMNVFIDMIFDVFKKDEFKDFFKVVSKFLK